MATKLSPTAFGKELSDAKLPLAYPGEDAYHSEYFSHPQSEMGPSCIVYAKNAQDVSNTLKIAKKHQIPFAVKSGGHMTWKGSSNIGMEGFTIDLSGLNTLELKSDNNVVLGPGLRWGEVYDYLEPKGRITVGARVTTVGVGGFLLGGGIALITPEKGIASSHVVSYEVVLASGEIVTADESSHPDLFWALKFGSTNFGIVTKFTVHTFEQKYDVFGGAQIYPASDALPVYEGLKEMIEQIETNPCRMFAPVITWHPPAGQYVLWVPYLQWGNLPSSSSDWKTEKCSPVAHKKLSEPILDTFRTDDIRKILTEWGASPVLSPSRNVWYSLTVKMDPSFLVEVYEKGKDIFKELLPGVNDTAEEAGKKDPQATWAFMTQPITRGYQSKSGSHPLKMADAKGSDDYFLLAFFNVWQEPSYDAPMEKAAGALYEWARDAAKERGLLSEFVYMNYATGHQVPGPYESLTDKDKLFDVRDKYDPEGTFTGLWKGGFKMGKKN